MGVKEALFTFSGRMKRLEYFLYSLANFGIMFVGFLLAIAIGESGNGAAVTLAILLGFSAFIVAVIGGIAITIKRLHDMGMVGSHFIWIWLLGLAGGALSTAAPGLAIVCNIASFGVALWLLFAPSVGDNQYGPKR